MILRLLLIFSLSSIGSSFIPAIELKRCGIDTACFIRKSCLVDESTTDAMIEAAKTVLVSYIALNNPLNNDTCDVVLQMRPFSDSKIHVMLQVISTEDISSDGVVLKQKEDQFQCSNGNVGTKNDKLEIMPFGERSMETQPQNMIFCSFILKTKDDSFIDNIFAHCEEYPEIIFTSGAQTILKYPSNRRVLWNEITVKTTCNPDFIESTHKFTTSHIYDKLDNSRSPIYCSESEVLSVENDGSTDYPHSIQCKERVWSYERKNEGETETVKFGLINGVEKKIAAACVTKTCSLCKALKRFDCGPGCFDSMFDNTAGQCVTSTCPNKLWRISNGDAIKGEMKCVHKIGSQNERESVWYFMSEGAEDREISEASCARDAVCLLPNPDQLTTITRLDCPSRDGRVLNCDPVQEQGTKKDLYCNIGFQLRYQLGDKITDTTNLTCSTITGKYSDDSKNEVPDGSFIFCEPIIGVTTTTTIASVAAASSFPTGTVVGVGVVLLIIIVVVGSIGGYHFMLKRKRREIEENEKILKEEFNMRAKLANEAAAPNPEVEVYRKEVPNELKTRWELRAYHWQNMEGHFMKKDEWEEKIKNWDTNNFETVVIYRFMTGNEDCRQTILRHLTAFDAYAVGERPEPKDRKPQDQYGNLRQFMTLWDHATTKMFDCPCCWEYMWRFMRMLYENFRPHDDKREICKVMLRRVVSFARPLLNELTYKARTWENSTDTLLRPLAIRMLLWAEAPDVIAEIRRQADLPIAELQVSIRPVVLQFAARNLGRAEVMMKELWDMIEQGTDTRKGDPYLAGTLRNHILFALCSARDEKAKGTPDEFKVLREMMKIMFKYDKMDYTTTSYTPMDQWWAVRGAAEFVSNMKPVLDLFIELVPKNMDEVYEKHVHHAVNWDLEKKDLVRLEWRYAVRNLYNLLAELCTIKAQFDEFAAIAVPMSKWVLQDNEKQIQFFAKELGERALNFGNLFARKDLTDVFYVGVAETSLDRMKKTDGNPEQNYINKKKKAKLNWSALHPRPERDDDDDD